MNTSSIKEVNFYNPRLSHVGIEVLTVADMLTRHRRLDTPERPDFYLLILIHAGSGKHMVDFIDHTLKPGTLLLVRPGQVQQWNLNPNLKGLIVLISGLAMASPTEQSVKGISVLELDEWPVESKPSPELWRETIGDIERLQRDIKQFEGSKLEVAITQHALLTLFLRLARELTSVGDIPSHFKEMEVYRRFMSELESTYHVRHSVLDYAKRLGYSQSTLSRACLAIRGRSAKQLIDRRLVLEAKRFLVHSRATTLEISHRLGFTEPTNFVKFFKRLEGTTPQEFRADSEQS